MSGLREQVVIKIVDRDLKGELFVGQDGLPEVRIKEEAVEGDVWQTFRPATIPATWTMRNPNGTLEGVLLEVWNAISYLRDRVICAQGEENGENGNAND